MTAELKTARGGEQPLPHQVSLQVKSYLEKLLQLPTQEMAAETSRPKDMKGAIRQQS